MVNKIETNKDMKNLFTDSESPPQDAYVTKFTWKKILGAYGGFEPATFKKRINKNVRWLVLNTIEEVLCDHLYFVSLSKKLLCNGVCHIVNPVKGTGF